MNHSYIICIAAASAYKTLLVKILIDEVYVWEFEIYVETGKATP